MRDASKRATPAAVSIPIDEVLDLHTFAPREVKDLPPEYLRECQVRGILQVRVVHGKGTGALRRQVHALLARSPAANQDIPDFSVRKCNTCEVAKDSVPTMVAGRPG